ncbi:MAG: ABC transporter permease [Thermoguttaceae bacterium]|jgi:putative ABC transport system permease protein
MKFILSLVLSRMKRQKRRLLFVLLAIAASSCLVVWTIGGFQALFIDETTQEANYLGEYDLRVASANYDATGAPGRGGTFSSPMSQRHYVRESSQPSAGAAKGRGTSSAIDPATIAAIREDEQVAQCDEVAALRMYVYSPGTRNSILEDPDGVDEGDRPTAKRSLDLGDEEIAEAPEGVDPTLHRQAFGAYRATMGTPMGMGSVFFATSALEAPFELKDGRWFSSESDDGRAPREAVLSVNGAERYKAKVGDPLLLIGVSSLAGPTVEYQLEVVGIVDDPELESFYVSRTLGRELANACETPFTTTALYLRLRGSVDAFRARWSDELAQGAAPLDAVTRDDLIKGRLDDFKKEQSFKFQAASGALLASLAALLIVFTALNTSVDAQRRLIAFYRVSGLTRAQVALSIFIEGAILAIPGWLAGMISGWALVFVVSGKATGLNWQTVGFSFLCTVVGAILASLWPMIQSARVKPLEALAVRTEMIPYEKTRRRQTRRMLVMAFVGAAMICGDAALIRYSALDTMERAAIHSGIGVMALAVGVVLTLPLAIWLTELVVAPAMAALLRIDSRLLRRELSGNAARVSAVAVALSVGGGLFVTMQIWGYSMLGPFLPGRRVPDAFVAFLPNGLRPESVEELKSLPFVDRERFMPVAVEQAAFAEGSIPENAAKSQFANVVFFGVEPMKAFGGDEPLIGLRFREGDPEKARRAMQSGRGVVVNDSISVDYGLKTGDTLKVVHPREPERVLEYPIVGVVFFEGWQWLSKTGGVRRNFGRSGGVVFARESVVADDYGVERRSYFWFDGPGGTPVDYAETETACDRLARKNLALDLAEAGLHSSEEPSRTAYVKLSTRQSLINSIMSRADNVIWGLSKTPLTTLVIASIAVVGAVANSVRSRRWQFGVMRALGLTRGAIVRIILVEATLIGVVASATSFFFGFLAAQGALKLGRSIFGTLNPPLILPGEGLLLGLALTLALCVAAAVYPALRAGRADVLRLLQSGRVSD